LPNGELRRELALPSKENEVENTPCFP
jgi:hypothetical protein